MNKLIAMQILVWEVMEGGRTSFDTVAPNVWGADPSHTNSLYNQVIYPNGGEIPNKADRANTLYGYYEAIIENVRIGEYRNSREERRCFG